MLINLDSTEVSDLLHACYVRELNIERSKSECACGEAKDYFDRLLNRVKNIHSRLEITQKAFRPTR